MKVPTVRAVIEGRDFPRDEILAWEASRIPKAAMRIGLPAPSGDLATQRLAFADAKIALGPEEIRRRLASQLRTSKLISLTATRLSFGRRALCICDLYSSGGDAASFVAWWKAHNRPDYTRSMIAAHPDHFFLGVDADGRHEIVETTGGSPLTARFFVDLRDTSTVLTPPDPTCSANISGIAQTDGGTIIGGVRHEFHDITGGFRARLLVEFPATFPAHMRAQHRLHLAAEFANWIEFAFSGAPLTR